MAAAVRAAARGRRLGALCRGLSASLPAASYAELRARAARDPAAFWGQQARAALRWDTPYSAARRPAPGPGATRWFLGGRLNVAGECRPACPGPFPASLRRGQGAGEAAPSAPRAGQRPARREVRAQAPLGARAGGGTGHHVAGRETSCSRAGSGPRTGRE